MVQPVNDLQRVQHFDDFDLAANRGQKLRFAAARLGEHFLGALVFSLAAAVIVHAISLAPTLNMIGLAFAVIVLVTLALWAIRLYLSLQKPVQSIDGVVSKRDYIPAIGYALALVTVGTKQFYVRPELYQLMEEDGIYKVYYVERSPRAGGNLFLSVETG